MPPKPHEDLYNMQRRLWRRNREIIEHSVLIKEPDFERYRGRYMRKIARFERVATQEEMLDVVLASDIIYVGDYHTCNQSQRSFLRVLRETVKVTGDFMIGMELIHKESQEILDKFMKGRLKESTFLEKIGFHQHWIFDLWGNFKPLFDFAKYHRIPVLALDAAGIDAPLKERDEASGKVIAEYLAKYPRKKLFVFIGDLHLAPEHLPAEVKEAFKKLAGSPSPNLSPKGRGIKTVTLYQNSESIYWELARKGIEDRVEVVKIDDGSFCRMHTPPVVSQQSYINWLEHEEGEIDYSDAKHSFLEMVDHISGFLGIKLGPEKDDIEVYTCGDLSFLKKLKRKRSFSKREFEIVKRQILHSESYYLAAEKIVYLANLSVNHAAEEAAHFMKNLCSGSEFPRGQEDAFYANILHEALGFFGSKLVNNKRKCLHEQGFRELFKYLRSVHIPTEREIEYETAHFVIEYLRYEKRGRSLGYSASFRHNPDLFMSITHALGYMLGDKMYYAMKSRELGIPAIRRLFQDVWRSDGEPYEVYSSLLKKVKGVKIPRRM